MYQTGYNNNDKNIIADSNDSNSTFSSLNTIFFFYVITESIFVLTKLDLVYSDAYEGHNHPYLRLKISFFQYYLHHRYYLYRQYYLSHLQ